MKVSITITHCTDCKFHRVIPDPDPSDSFNYDDIAVICIMSANPNYDPSSKYASDRQKNRVITYSCRPYNKKKESEVPLWCPLAEKLKEVV
jgi:hypothetical protein